MTSSLRRLRERLHDACGALVVCIQQPQTAPAQASSLGSWSAHTTESLEQNICSENGEAEIQFPWMLPEGLLHWLADWGCQWVVQQGVQLPPPERSALRRLKQLRVDPPQETAGPHQHRERLAAAQMKQESLQSRSSKGPSFPAAVTPPPAVSESKQEIPASASQQTDAPARKSPLSQEETAAGIPQLYLDLARAWQRHPRWQLPLAALLCPVSPVHHQLQELAIHLAGALAHLEKREILVADFRPQAPAGLWRHRGQGLWDLLDSEQPLAWESLLCSTAYQRVWHLPRGRRRTAGRRKANAAARWKELLEQWQKRFAAVLILGAQATTLTAEQIPAGGVQCCLLAAVDASSRQEVLAAKKHLQELSGSLPLCFALPDESCSVSSPARAA